MHRTLLRLSILRFLLGVRRVMFRQYLSQQLERPLRFIVVLRLGRLYVAFVGTRRKRVPCVGDDAEGVISVGEGCDFGRDVPVLDDQSIGYASCHVGRSHRPDICQREMSTGLLAENVASEAQ